MFLFYFFNRFCAKTLVINMLIHRILLGTISMHLHEEEHFEINVEYFVFGRLESIV